MILVRSGDSLSVSGRQWRRDVTYTARCVFEHTFTFVDVTDDRISFLEQD